MITREQLLNGLLQYIDAEVMPALPTSGKWITGGIITLGSIKFNDLINKLIDNPIVMGLDLINPDGTIEIEPALSALKTSADKYGALEITLPIVGVLRFTGDDITKLRRYMVINNDDRRIKSHAE